MVSRFQVKIEPVYATNSTKKGYNGYDNVTSMLNYNLMREDKQVNLTELLDDETSASGFASILLICIYIAMFLCVIVLLLRYVLIQ